MRARKTPKIVAKLDCSQWLSQSPLLRHWVNAPTTQQRVARRSRIVLLALQGVAPSEIASHTHVSLPTVKLWIRRFAAGGAEALAHDAVGRGRRAVIDAATARARLQEANLLRPDGMPTSLRSAAAFLHISASSVRRAFRRTA